MNRFSHLAWFALAMITLTGCGVSTPPPPSKGPAPAAPADRLRNIVERYWDENAARDSWYAWGGSDLQFGAAPAESISPQALADSLDTERRYLAEVSAIPRPSLDAESKLTYDLFRRERGLAIEGFTYPLEMLPVNPFDGMPQQFALLAAATERHALSNAGEYAAWNARVLSIVNWTNQAIVDLRDGLRRGYTIPRGLVERAIPQLAALGEDAPGNVFFQPLRPISGPPPSLDPEQQRLNTAMTALLREKVLPSYRALHDFLQREYLPRSRTSVGLGALPLGDAWYAYRVRRITGGAATPAQLQALGSAEVERLHGAVQALLTEASFPGNAQAYWEGMGRDPRYSYSKAEELLRAYEDLKVQVTAALPTLFSALPAAEYGIRSVETFRESTAPALAYRPRSPNGVIPAVLYVDTARLDSRAVTSPAAQYLREVLPGHHYQLSMQRERNDLPRFRRFAVTPAFVEGWGLYALTLGGELGVYHDSQARFGALLEEMRCAVGLVIDTGIHAQGWTRAKALEYLQAQIPMDADAAQATVDRAIARPADALACTVGFLKIKELRKLAEQTLGTRFDLRAFHLEIVKDGAMPLDLLEIRTKAWVAAELAAPPKVLDAPPAAAPKAD
jgi:uncharacterized protein (DUF885 family)